MKQYKPFIVFFVLLLVLAGCGSDEPEVAPLPTRTPRPTFTPTPIPAAPQPVVPVADTPTPVPAPVEAAPAAEQPPTDTPTPAPQTARAVITNPVANLRAGPGTNYALAGSVERGSEFEIVGKNPAGDWWQLCCVNGAQVWIAAFLVDTSGPVDGVAVAADIPAPPPTVPPPPTNTPAPAQPTNTPAPVFSVVKGENVEPRPNTNPIVSFFGMLCQNVCPHGGAASGYKLIVEGPHGRSEGAFIDTFSHGDPGLPSQFFYNVKIEVPGAPPGGYRAYVTDGGGNQVSEAWEYTVTGNMRTFLPRWVAP